MSAASFGAATRLPLADCPFKRSPLTVADAQVEAQIIEQRVPIEVVINEEVVDRTPEIDYGPRVRTPEAQGYVAPDSGAGDFIQGECTRVE